MADAFLSKDHFYLNASYYNNTSEDQDAIIHIEDNADILTRNDGWLVHVTRFSCDSMNSVMFVEKDESATWNITIVNEKDVAQQEFFFTLDRDYATPADLIDSMNLVGRSMQMHTLVHAGVNGFAGREEIVGDKIEACWQDPTEKSTLC